MFGPKKNTEVIQEKTKIKKTSHQDLPSNPQNLHHYQDTKLKTTSQTYGSNQPLTGINAGGVTGGGITTLTPETTGMTTGPTGMTTGPTGMTTGTTGMTTGTTGMTTGTTGMTTGTTNLDSNMNKTYGTTFTTPATTGLMTGTTEVPVNKTTFQSNIIPNKTQGFTVPGQGLTLPHKPGGTLSSSNTGQTFSQQPSTYQKTGYVQNIKNKILPHHQNP